VFLASASAADSKPQRVAMGGEVTSAIGDAGDNLENDGVTLTAFSHTSHRLGDGADERPGPAADVMVAGGGIMLGRHIQDAVFSCGAVNYPKPVHPGIPQMRYQARARPRGSAGQITGT
jgi:hypothetical protein